VPGAIWAFEKVEHIPLFNNMETVRLKFFKLPYCLEFIFVTCNGCVQMIRKIRSKLSVFEIKPAIGE